MKISWIDIIQRLKFEFQQCEEEGLDVGELRNEWSETEKFKLSEDELRKKAEIFYRILETNISVSQNVKQESSSFEAYISRSNLKSDAVPDFATSFIEDKILGGWQGRSAGCLLGKPIEKIQRAGIIELLSSNGTWPISDYISGEGIPDSLQVKYPWNRHGGKESLKENIVCMAEDDDMNYPMMNLSLFEQYGNGFTTENVIQSWMEMMPVLSSFTAERVAYINALNGLLPPETALNRNPYREWIGAQIRADLWGWISPSQPLHAAEYAWRDARLSHVSNGIYGEVFFAVVLALSFKYDDIETIVKEALTFIPSQSRFAEAINFVLELPIHDQSWDATVEVLYKTFGKYHWVHSINNAALVVAALLSSKGDFETAICNVVMGGWDTDSNGATTGSIMGTILGANKLPPKWISPLNNKIRSSVKGFDNSLITDLAKRTVMISNYSSK